MRNIIKRDYKFFIALIIAIIASLLLSFYIASLSDNLYNKSDEIKTNGYVSGITEGTEITEKITCSENNLEKIYIEFEPLKENATAGGTVIIGLKDEKGKIVKEEKIERNHIRDNNVYKFKFDTQKESLNKEYVLYIKFDKLNDHSEFYSVKYLKEKTFENTRLFVDNEEQEGTLDIQIFYINRLKTNTYIALAIILSIIVMFISIMIYYKKEIKEENIFLLIVPIIYIIFLLAMPTFKSHDEGYHWIRAYELSMGKLASEINGDIFGTEMPTSVIRIETDDWTKITYGKIRDTLDISLEPNKKDIIYSATSALHSFMAFLPQAIGISVSRIFTESTLIMAYCGRFTGMITAITLLYFSIKLMPFGKKIFLVPAFIPIAIECFTSFSPDSITISIVFFFIAYVFNLAFKKEGNLTKKNMLVLAILSIIIALCKIVYIPIVGLLLIIPREKFQNKNKKNIKILVFGIIAIIAIIANLVWTLYATQYLANFRDGDSKYQVINALSNPIQVIQTSLYTINLNLNKYITSMFGVELGWGEFIKIYSIVPYTLLLLYLFTTITDNTIKNVLKKYQKIIMILIILCISTLIFASLYVQWTKVGNDSILGVQGRYFLPIIPLIMILIGNSINIKSFYNDTKITKLVGIVGIVIQLYVILQIVINHM